MKKRMVLLMGMFLLSVLVLTGCGQDKERTGEMDEALFPEPIALGLRETASGGTATDIDAISENDLSNLEISGYVDDDGIQEMMNRINGYRQDKGVKTLNMNPDLMDAAELRAAEITLCYSHLRPNRTAPYVIHNDIKAEVIGAGKDVNEVFEKWSQKPDNAQLLANGKMRSVGISNFGNPGRKTFWVILFSTKKSKSDKIGQHSGISQKEIAYDPEFCPVEYVLHQTDVSDDWQAPAQLGLNEQISLEAVISPYLPNIRETETDLGAAIIQPNQIKWLTANPHVATVKDGVVTSVGDGKTVIDAVFDTYMGMKEIYSGDADAEAIIETGETPEFLTRKFNVYGHRGFSARYPENSILSFIKAAECPAFDGMENDVHTTEDGQIIIMHDDTVDRMTGIKGKISELTFDQTQKITLINGAGFTSDLEGQLSIPTLKEYLDICYDYNKIAMIELKSFLKYERDIPGLVAFLNDYKDGWFKTHSIFISFNTNYLNKVAECTSVYPLEVMPGGDISVAQSKELFDKVLKGREESYTMIFRPSVGQLFKAGTDAFVQNKIPLDCWGLKTGDKETFDKLKENGVLGITLDSPEGLGLDMDVPESVK